MYSTLGTLHAALIVANPLVKSAAQCGCRTLHPNMLNLGSPNSAVVWQQAIVHTSL